MLGRPKGYRFISAKIVVDVPHTVATSGPGYDGVVATLTGDVTALATLRTRIDGAIRDSHKVDPGGCRCEGMCGEGCG